ncbi:MAG: hypothetical protein ABW039_07160 [Sphingobium sp.]
MTGMTRTLMVGAIALTLTACGGRQPLKPLEGQPPPATPVGANAPPTPADLTTPSTQGRPERSVELLSQSEERSADPFDLPPQGPQ